MIAGFLLDTDWNMVNPQLARYLFDEFYLILPYRFLEGYVSNMPGGEQKAWDYEAYFTNIGMFSIEFGDQ